MADALAYTLINAAASKVPVGAHCGVRAATSMHTMGAGCDYRHCPHVETQT
jgi:hypothetical protein